MSNLSFDIKTSRDFFLKLQEDYSEFRKNRTSSRIALNCAMTAWHLTDWIYNEYKSQLESNFATLTAFQQEMKNLCPSLQIMHDLANGSKHYLLTKHKPIIEETNLHKGAFSNAFSRDFDISTLDIKLNNGKKIYFEDEIKKTLYFWATYLKSILNIDLDHTTLPYKS
ncbi:MAG: hypothetical protein ACO1O6_06730 [Bacteroidota bacterium]